MNEYDSNRILDKVKGIDYIKTSNIDEADCYILNTCHIREKATKKFIMMLEEKKGSRQKKTKHYLRMCCTS